jgi:O-antigen/teichoic acid export membrane protein
MAIIGAALPVAYQSDRLVLAHFSTISAVAMYSAAAQLFTPLLSLVAVSGQALWPLFRARQSRSQAVKRSELLLYTAVFATIGALGALALVLAGPTAACWLTAGAVRPSGVLMAVFGSLLAIHAIHLPAGMLALDPAGMRFQAKTSTVMALVNVPLSILLAAKMGAAGPAIASAVSIAAVMLVPTQLRVYRQMNASGAL